MPNNFTLAAFVVDAGTVINDGSRTWHRALVSARVMIWRYLLPRSSYLWYMTLKSKVILEIQNDVGMKDAV